MGTALRRLGRAEEAVACFRQAIEWRAPYFEAHMNLADALEAAGRLEEAGRMYQAILSFARIRPWPIAGTAGVLQDQGRPERGRPPIGKQSIWRRKMPYCTAISCWTCTTIPRRALRIAGSASGLEPAAYPGLP